MEEEVAEKKSELNYMGGNYCFKEFCLSITFLVNNRWESAAASNSCCLYLLTLMNTSRPLLREAIKLKKKMKRSLL